MRKLVWVLLFLLLLPCSALALTDPTEEQMNAYGADSLTEALPEDAEVLLDGAKPEIGWDFGTTLKKILVGTLEWIPRTFQTALQDAGKILAIAVLCGIVQIFAGQADCTLPVVSIGGAAGIAAVTLETTTALAQSTVSALNSISAFTRCLLPVVTAAGAASGAVVSAGSHYAAGLFLCGAVMTFLSDTAVTAIFCYIALQFAAAVSGNAALEKLGELVKWGVSTALKVILTLFLSYFSMNGILSGTASSAALKSVRLGLSTALPLVGTVMADAAESVLTGAKLVRNTVGSFGSLAILAAAILPLLRLGLRWSAYRLAAAATGLCGVPQLEKLTEGLAEACGMLLGLLGACTLLAMLASCTGMLLGGFA